MMMRKASCGVPEQSSNFSVEYKYFSMSKVTSLKCELLNNQKEVSYKARSISSEKYISLEQRKDSLSFKML